MNTHLHILEPYTNLYRVWKDERLGKQIYNLVNLFLDKILDAETYHLNLFLKMTGLTNIRLYHTDMILRRHG